MFERSARDLSRISAGESRFRVEKEMGCVTPQSLDLHSSADTRKVLPFRWLHLLLTHGGKQPDGWPSIPIRGAELPRPQCPIVRDQSEARSDLGPDPNIPPQHPPKIPRAL